MYIPAGGLHMDIVRVAKIKATKGDVTWDDSQWRLLMQHSIAIIIGTVL